MRVMDATRDKPSPREAKAVEQEPTVTAARSPVRCPYCHDACSPEDAAAIVCQQCLSRHHGGCWREGGGRCASCSSTRALQPSPPQVTVAPAELELVRRGLAREAVERVVRRLQVTEAEATTALLEAASRALSRTSRGPTVAGALVAIVAILATMIFLIVAVLSGT